MALVVIRYETKTAARRALTFIVRIFVNDTIAITVWTSFYFHVAAYWWLTPLPAPAQPSAWQTYPGGPMSQIACS